MKKETMMDDSEDKAATYGTSEVDPEGATEQVDAVYEMYQELSSEDKKKFMDMCEAADTNDEMTKVAPKTSMKKASKMPKSFSMDEMPSK